ncbi:MAG: hypothetical protein JEZ09_02800 [Salinivirgaceae bacterium]|nr:hypothetical protein [Salinivirgaceae bacterium]
MKILLINICISIFTTSLLAQEYNIYQQDFNELTKIVHTSYPLNDSTNTLLLKLEPVYLNKLENCKNKDVFLIVAEQYLAKLSDGHTKIDCYTPFTRKGRHPISFNFINDKLFISNYPNTIPKKYLGSQVVRINNICIDTIAKRAKKYISADNPVDLRNYLHWLLNLPTFYDYINIDANSELKLQLVDGSKLCWVRDFDTREFYMLDKNIKYSIDTLKQVYYKKKENEFTGWSNKLFEYKIMKQNNACYFNFRECMDMQWLSDNPGYFKPFPDWLIKISWYLRGGSFSEFCSKMFNEIDKNGVENLIIDLRSNKGGTSILGYQLLDYLTDIDNIKDYSEALVLSELLKNTHPDYFNRVVKEEKLILNLLPQIVTSDNSNGINDYLREKESAYYQAKPSKKFKGKVYVLVGNKTFSSAAMIAVLFADNNLATIVGNPMGMGASHKGEVLNFKLSNTDVKGTLSCKRFTRPDITILSTELTIDVKLTNSERNNFEGVDYEFEELLKRINLNNN